MSVTPIEGVRYWYDEVLAAFTAPGRPSLPVVDPDSGPSTPPTTTRDSLVNGTYEPDASTTGVPSGTVLTDYNSSSVDKVVIPAGAVITEKTVYGDMTFAGAAKFYRCEFVGGTSFPTGDIGIASCTGARRSGLAEFYDCDFDPRVPANGRNGILGRQYKAVRCHVRNTTDGFGVYSTLGAGTTADVDILGCWVEQTLYTYPDPATSNHADGAHSDGVQIQGGRNINIIGNSFWGYSIAQDGSGINPQKPWLLQHVPGWANGACVIVQDNTGAGIDGTVIIDKNWTRGALSHYNIKPSAAGSQISNGRVYRDVAIGTGQSGYWVRLDPGLTETSIVGINTHVWIDGPYAGQSLTFASRDRGMIIG